MMLKGGIQKDELLNQGQGGGMPSGQGGGMSSGQMLGNSGHPVMSLVGAIKQDVDERKQGVKDAFKGLQEGMMNNALAASSFRTNFNPTMAQINPASMMQAQQVQPMNNLYQYLRG